MDSRHAKPGNLFFALKGERTDGHAFLEDVAKKGCSAAVVAKNYDGPDYGLVIIRVDDVLHTLQMLAKSVLEESTSRIIAVTGSLGKTTTKDFIHSLLKHKYRVAASPGNYNSQIGLPLAILNHLKGDEEFVILEMGMTEAGQINKLVNIAPPEIAVITTVALVHAENFDSLKEIALAKGEIFSHPKTHVAIMHREMEFYEELTQIGTCRKIPVVSRSCQLAVQGVHNQQNFMVAATVVHVLGMEWDEIENASQSLTLPERRLERVERQGVLFINDSYNAAVPSVKSALASIPQPGPGGRRIAFLGTMPELGKFSDQCHREVGEFSLNCVDKMYCLGLECQPIYETWKKAKRPVLWSIERAELVESLSNELREGDVVLLKGANKLRLWEVIDDLHTHEHLT